jgi:hypothetical protein
MKIKDGYVQVAQFKELNLLQQIDTRKDEVVIEKSFMSERQSIIHKELTVYIDPESLGGQQFQFVTSTKRLLTFVQAELAANRQNEIVFTIRDFARICNRTGIPDLAKQVRLDLIMLNAISFDVSTKNGTVKVKLFESFSVQYGTVTIQLSSDLFNTWKNRKGAMKLPLSYFTISARECPVAIDFMYYLSMIRFVGNKSKKHENTVSIKSLLMVSILPSPENVRKTRNRSIKEKIYDRFFGAMHVMNSVTTPSYYLADRIITEQSIMKLPYHDFMKINVHFEWS